MTKQSAGILLYRVTDAAELQVWIAHMGGPFWAHKNERAWSIPKGEYEDPRGDDPKGDDPKGEDPRDVAFREFQEEMGVPAPDADYAELGVFRQPSGKVVTVFAAETDFHPEHIESNTFSLEWPRGSGRVRDFPEVDEARWVSAAEARVRLVLGQVPLIDAVENRLLAAGRLLGSF